MNNKLIMRYKYFFLFIALAVPILGSAAGASAAMADALPAAPQTCAALSTFSQKILDDVSERASVLERDRATRVDQLVSAWTDQDSQNAAGREQADQIKDLDFTALEKALANAPAPQKKALAAFEAALTLAASTRQSAIDAATQAFRTGVQNTLQTRSADIHFAIDDFTGSLQASLHGAVADCPDGAVPAGLQGKLKNSLQSARESFQQDPRLAAAKPVDVNKLSEQYQAAIQSATAAFKTQVLSAQASFKAALAG
jgi:hypothetical protein